LIRKKISYLRLEEASGVEKACVKYFFLLELDIEFKILGVIGAGVQWRGGSLKLKTYGQKESHMSASMD